MTLDERMAYLEGRLEDHSGTVISLRGDMHALRADVQGLRADISRQFTWLVGIQVAMLVAMIGAILR